MSLSITGGFAVLSNTILGPGMLGLPWAFAQCGSGLGLVMFVVSFFVAAAGMHLLAASAMVTAPRLKGKAITVASISTCAHNAVFGRTVKILYEVGGVVAAAGAVITSLIIIGDMLGTVSDAATEKEFTFIVFCVAAFPLSFFPKISFLRYSSLVSFVMCVYVTMVVVLKAASHEHEHAGKQEAFRYDNGWGILQAAPVFTFTFCGHMTVPNVAAELKNATMARLDFIIGTAIFAAAVLYLSACLGAYGSFGNDTPQDLLKIYEADAAITSARLGMAYVCTAFYPLLVAPIRIVFMGWLDSYMRRARGAPMLSEGDSNGAPSAGSHTVDGVESGAVDGAGADKSFLQRLFSAHVAFTVLIGGVALAVAVSTDDLGEVLSLFGATGFALLCNICPPLLYIAVAPAGESRATYLMAVVLTIIGVVMMPVCLYANLMK
jgi:amino acid permease